MKWTVLGAPEQTTRFELLSSVLESHGRTNEFVVWPHESVNFETFAEIADYKHVRLAHQWGLTIARNMKLQSSWTSLLGVSDGMVHTSDGWWPLCALYEAIGQLLGSIGSDLDTTKSVLVAGAGGAARVAIAALFKSGFRSFLVSNVQEAEGRAMVKELAGRFFGLSIEFVPKDKIVQLPGDTSLLVNCTPSAVENPLLAELCYLNFLKRPGIFIDLSLAKNQNQLLLEAIDSGVQVHSGVDVAARVDVLWAKWAFQCDIALDAYRALMIEKLNLPAPPDKPHT